MADGMRLFEHDRRRVIAVVVAVTDMWAVQFCPHVHNLPVKVQIELPKAQTNIQQEICAILEILSDPLTNDRNKVQLTLEYVVCHLKDPSFGWIHQEFFAQIAN